MRLDDLTQMVAFVLGEAGAGLVHHHQPGLPDRRARDLDHAAVEGVEVAPELARARRQADEIERLVDEFAPRRPVGRHVVEHGGDIVLRGQVFHHLLVLERAADAEGGALVRS